MENNLKFENATLKAFIETDVLDKNCEYEYTIEKSPDPYNKFYTLFIMSSTDIIDQFIYHDKQQAENDAEVLEHLFNIREA